MANIDLLDELLKQYKIWTLKLRSASKNIEDNILQKDSSSKVEEKVISIAISSALVYIGSAIIGLFGVSMGGVWFLVLFAIGWLLSRGINKKVFGNERKHETLADEERVLLDKLHALEQTHIKIRDGINNKTMPVFFTAYVILRREFNEMINKLLAYNASHLALKYRYKHTLLVKKYQQQADHFHKIYTNKKGR